MYDKEKIKKIIIIVSIFTILIISISIFFIITKKQPQEVIHGDGLNTVNTVVFENRYQLDYSVGKSSSASIASNIESTILKQTEIESAPYKNQPDGFSDNYYISIIQEESFKKIPDDNNPTYSFNINTSDGRVYYILIITDPSYGSEYIITFIKRINNGSTESVAYIDSKQDIDITNWVSLYNFTNTTIIKNSNYSP